MTLLKSSNREKYVDLSITVIRYLSNSTVYSSAHVNVLPGGHVYGVRDTVAAHVLTTLLRMCESVFVS